MTLEDAIDKVMGRPTQSSLRLAPLADYAIEQLEYHGLPGVKGGSSGELRIKGLARSKDWDVAYDFAGKPRLLLSLKSIRKAPVWNQGLIEGTWFIMFDSRKPKGTRVLDAAKVQNEGDAFFQSLLRELKIREPAVPFTKSIS